MKISSKFLMLFMLSGICYVNAQAQKIEEGKVVYEISYPDSDMPDEQLAQMPTEMILVFKDYKSRMDMKMGMGMTTVTISDGKAKTATTLFDMMGNKMAVKMTEDEIKTQKVKSKGDYEVKITDETKEIAGYKAKKAIITGKEDSYDIYFTDAIVNKTEWEPQFKGVNGFLMEYNMKQGPMLMKMKAKSVSPEKIEDTVFDIPADYKIMTQDEMKTMFGGGK